MYVPHICAEAPPTSLPCAARPAPLPAGGEKEKPAARRNDPPGKVLQLTHPPAPDSARRQFVLVFLEKFVLRHFLFDDIGEFNDEVPHLFLKNRCPPPRQRIVIFLEVV